MRFTVKLGSKVVGFSDVSTGDPSMGCAYGRFIPTQEYSCIQKHCVAVRDNWVPLAGLSVEVADGRPVQCAGGFQIVDCSPELGEEGIELHLLGITEPRYEELFPGVQS